MPNCVLSFHTRAVVNNIAIAPDGGYAAFAEQGGPIEIYDLKSGRPYLALDDTGMDEVYALMFSPDGKLLAAGGAPSAVRVWDARTGACVSSFGQHEWDIVDLAFSPDGQFVASASLDHTVRIWNVYSGEVFQVYEHAWEVTSIDWSHNGSRIASGDFLGNIRVWHPRTGVTLREYTKHATTLAFGPDAEGISDLVFSPNDLLIASSQICKEGGAGQLLVWEVESGNTRWSYRDTARRSDFIHDGLGWLPNGGVVGAMLDGSLHLLAAGMDSGVRVLEVPSMGYAGRMLPDGTFLFSDKHTALVHRWAL